MTVGPVFTEEMWRLACCALQDAFSATLEPVKVGIFPPERTVAVATTTSNIPLFQNLLACFRSGSDSFAGDACEVKVAAPSHSPAAEAEYWRIKAMAQQVRTSTRCTPGPPRAPAWSPQVEDAAVCAVQVFMLDTQCPPKTPSSKDGFEHAQSCLLLMEVPSSQAANGHPQKR